MGPRVARASTSAAAPKTAKNKNRKRNLDAYAIASHSAPEKLRMRQHRLGETIDDNPRQKRRRLQDDDEDSEGEEHLDSARRRQERNVTKRTGTGVNGGLGGANEDAEEGSDSSGNEWTMGGLAEDDDDSELDSDEAFGSSDEERFEGFTFRGSSSNKGKKKTKKSGKSKGGDIDLDEGESEQEEEDDDDESLGEDAVDLATMLDDDVDDEQLGGKDKTTQDLGEESAEESGSEEDDEGSDDESDDALSDENDDHVDEEGLSRLRDFVDTLNDEVGDGKDNKKRSEDKVHANQTLSLDDLLGNSNDPSVQKSIKSIQKPTRKAKGVETLAPALPKRQQDRIDREVASKKAKEQLDRWRDTVIQNRRADFLQFPLADPNAKEPVGKDKFTTTSLQDKPRTELEESIQKIMEESGMASKPGQKPADEEGDLLKSEELATNKLPIEEVMKRRSQLRKARELLFQEEKKAKRISKIKSKSYRRVHRKQREREAEKNRELMGSDMDEDEKERADRMRAEERMGAKHRNSKWSRSVKATNRAAWDDDAREGVHDMARRNEDLRRRIAGKEVSDDDHSGVSSDDDESADGEDQGDAKTLKQLQNVKGSDVAPEKGLCAMKFMRAADERRRAQNDEDAERLRKELVGEDSDDKEQDESLGRAIFGPKSKGAGAALKPKRPEMEEAVLSEDEESGELAPAPTTTDNQARKQQQPKSTMMKGDGSGPLSRAAVPDRRDVSQTQSSRQQQDDGDAVSSWLAPKSKKAKKATSRDAESEGGLLTTKDVSKPVSKEPKPDKTAKSNAKRETASTAPNTDGWQTVPYSNAEEGEASDADSEAAAQPLVSGKAGNNKKSMHNRVFASDDVQSAFAAEKADLAASEDEKETSNHLPGWGSWAGTGLSKRTAKHNKKIAHNPLHKTKVAGTKQEHRRDKGREDVIISEKQDRKGKKYMAPVLPHGFEKADEYERSLRVPVGPEWTTKETFQKGTKPRVVVKPGAVVEAMERPLV